MSKKLKPPPIQTIGCRSGIWNDKPVVLLGEGVLRGSKMLMISEITAYPGMVGFYRAVDPLLMVNELAVRWSGQTVEVVVEVYDEN